MFPFSKKVDTDLYFDLTSEEGRKQARKFIKSSETLYAPSLDPISAVAAVAIAMIISIFLFIRHTGENRKQKDMLKDLLSVGPKSGVKYMEITVDSGLGLKLGTTTIQDTTVDVHIGDQNTYKVVAHFK